MVFLVVVHAIRAAVPDTCWNIPQPAIDKIASSFGPVAEHGTSVWGRRGGTTSMGVG